MNDEQRVVQEIIDKQKRGEKLTEREELMLAYSPYGTAAGRSFGRIRVHVHRDLEK